MSIVKKIEWLLHDGLVEELSNCSLQVSTANTPDTLLLPEELLVFQFGGTALEPARAGTVRLALQPLTPASQRESWRVTGPVCHRHDGPLHVAESAHYTAFVVELEEAGNPDLKSLSLEAYEILLTALSDCQHKKLLRIWNYFDDINEYQNGEERYRLFSSGRAVAFSKVGIREQTNPVGTAIGTHDSGKLVLIALASDLPFESRENPRQISAYHYPLSYGTDSPKFSRAGLLEQPDGSLFLVSGTAAIIGHTSAFHYDSSKQLQETLINLQLLTHAGRQSTSGSSVFRPGAESVIRVYLRDAQDLEIVTAALLEAWGALPPNLLFLKGDICRRELMLEIEAVIHLD